ncbi:VOC family protein [Actinomadura hibisca]|uniref:VOC family protein n=1 Tax=Actinomadura hibisca TaxID=68565 RepID=UPI000836CAFA|nr:VOC family protein [Actinomadura hibisca]
MLRGLTTVTFYADDVAAARDWYSEFLGMEAYFDRSGPDGQPAYIEFRIGDYLHELGIVNSRFAPATHDGEPGGAIVHWHVDDLTATLERLLELGAKEHTPPTEHGPGFVTASVIDPFGNILGIMYNVHYLDVLSTVKQG